MKNRISKPNFLIIGAAKCGTTTLASILANHSDCCISRPKEVSFFQDAIDGILNVNYGRGWDWYQTAFSHYKGEPLVGEATPSYTDRAKCPNTSRRIFEFNPQFKLIYLVREPLSRAVSSWKMQFYEARHQIHPQRIETHWALKGFEFWMNQQIKTEWWKNYAYQYQLDAYLAYFPKEQLHVSFLEDWRIDQQSELDQIFQFLGLRPEAIDAQAENRADQRQTPTWLARWGARTNVTNLVKAFVPAEVWSNLRNRFSKRAMSVPTPSVTTQVCRTFVEMLKDDHTEFLNSWGKPTDFWSSIRQKRANGSSIARAAG